MDLEQQINREELLKYFEIPDFALEIERERDYWKGNWRKDFEECVFIIVGTWEGSELFDRFAAYRIGFELQKRGLRWLVITDKYWEEVESLYIKSPVITVGGPAANSFSFRLSKKRGLGNIAIGFELIDRLVGFVWGEFAYQTLSLARAFIERYLDHYASIAKSVFK